MIAPANVVFLSLLALPGRAQEPVQPAPAAQVPAQAQAPADLPSYARAGSRGARLRSLADEKGHLLCDVPAGTVLKLRGERAGWVQAEIPGGFATWVSGQYLRETEVPGTLELNGDRVNMRPLPQADNVNNFPVGVLQRGTRVQLIERARPDLALQSDWVRIWTPEGNAGWLRKAEVEALEAGADGAQVWAAALAKGTHLPAPIFARPAQPGAAPAAVVSGTSTPAPAVAAPAVAAGAAPAPVAPSEAEIELANARTLLEAARHAEQPDLALVRAAYERVIALDTRAGELGSHALAARVELENVRMLDSVAAMRAEMEASKVRVAQELAVKQQQVLRDAAARDPLALAYSAHGTLARRTDAAGNVQYWLVQGSRDVCQLICTTGRYSLELYSGRYLGVHAQSGDKAAAAGQTGAAAVQVVDAMRIEVLRP
ncbi:MAG: SH3 domain-containing protein [Planctomycetes bacterium]|nr:SH3 domain-containing protein [Planctomycetota bacterium]